MIRQDVQEWLKGSGARGSLKLPVWIYPVIAIRSLQRCSHFFRHDSSAYDESAECYRLVRRAIALAEESAAQAAARELNELRDLSGDLRDLQRRTSDSIKRQVLRSANYLVVGVADALIDSSSVFASAGLSIDSAHQAISIWYRTQRSQSSHGESHRFPAEEFLEAVQYDVIFAEVLASREGWDNSTAVSPIMFGPLWPFGEPDSWPESDRELPAGNREWKLTIDVPRDAPNKEASDRIAGLVKLLDKLHRAQGGSGLELTGLDAHSFKQSLIPVGGPAQ